MNGWAGKERCHSILTTSTRCLFPLHRRRQVIAWQNWLFSWYYRRPAAVFFLRCDKAAAAEWGDNNQKKKKKQQAFLLHLLVFFPFVLSFLTGVFSGRWRSDKPTRLPPLSSSLSPERCKGRGDKLTSGPALQLLSQRHFVGQCEFCTVFTTNTGPPLLPIRSWECSRINECLFTSSVQMQF